MYSSDRFLVHARRLHIPTPDLSLSRHTTYLWRNVEISTTQETSTCLGPDSPKCNNINISCYLWCSFFILALVTYSFCPYGEFKLQYTVQLPKSTKREPDVTAKRLQTTTFRTPTTLAQDSAETAISTLAFHHHDQSWTLGTSRVYFTRDLFTRDRKSSPR